MTHQELTNRAARWLRGSIGCQVVVTKASVMANEQPDALGWTAGGKSNLVEAKASRSDFLRDHHKFFRSHPATGMGNLRWYLVPARMVVPGEVPLVWGLLWCYCTKIVEVKPAVWQSDKNTREELIHLLNYVRQPESLVIPDLDPECWDDVGL